MLLFPCLRGSQLGSVCSGIIGVGTLSRDVGGKLREREVPGCDFLDRRCELAVVRKVVGCTIGLAWCL